MVYYYASRDEQGKKLSSDISGVFALSTSPSLKYEYAIINMQLFEADRYRPATVETYRCNIATNQDDVTYREFKSAKFYNV